jgi:hypothetical protein
MSPKALPRVVSSLVLIVSFHLVSWPSLAAPFVHAFGGGWDCDRGYRKDARACVVSICPSARFCLVASVGSAIEGTDEPVGPA